MTFSTCSACSNEKTPQNGRVKQTETTNPAVGTEQKTYSSDEVTDAGVGKRSKLAVDMTNTRAWGINHHTPTLP